MPFKFKLARRLAQGGAQREMSRGGRRSPLALTYRRPSASPSAIHADHAVPDALAVAALRRDGR